MLKDASRRQFAIDTATPMGKLVFPLTGAFAEFERTVTSAQLYSRVWELGATPNSVGEQFLIFPATL